METSFDCTILSGADTMENNDCNRSPRIRSIKLRALLKGRTMDVYIRMSVDDANAYDKLKKAMISRHNFTEDGYRKRFREVRPEMEETPDQFLIHLNFLAKWLELSGSSGTFWNSLSTLVMKN